MSWTTCVTRTLNALKRKQSPGLDWPQPFPHRALVPGLAGRLCRAERWPRARPCPRGAAPEGTPALPPRAPPLHQDTPHCKKQQNPSDCWATETNTALLSYRLTPKYIIPWAEVNILRRKALLDFSLRHWNHQSLKVSTARAHWLQQSSHKESQVMATPLLFDCQWKRCPCNVIPVSTQVNHWRGRRPPLPPGPGSGRDAAMAPAGSPEHHTAPGNQDTSHRGARPVLLLPVGYSFPSGLQWGIQTNAHITIFQPYHPWFLCY